MCKKARSKWLFTVLMTVTITWNSYTLFQPLLYLTSTWLAHLFDYFRLLNISEVFRQFLKHVAEVQSKVQFCHYSRLALYVIIAFA
jgi:hypothetical protein